MKAHIKLGRIFGVAIGLHYSWIIIALLVTLSLRAQFAMEHPNWNGSTTWSIAIITGLLFFVSILLHELRTLRLRSCEESPCGQLRFSP